MVDHPRLALGPRRLAVHAGTGGTAGREANGEVRRQKSSSPRKRGCSTPRLHGSVAGVSGILAWGVVKPAMTAGIVDTTYFARELSRAVEELKRVNRGRSFADLEVELRRPHLARLARFG